MQALDQLLAQGLSHNEVVKKAHALGIDEKKVHNFLANIADAPQIKEHRPAIVSLQVYMLTLNCLAMGSMVWLGWHENALYYLGAGVGLLFTIAFWYGINRHRAAAYVAVCNLTALACLQALRGLKEAPTMIAVCIVLNLVLIAMAARLKFKLFPHQNFFNTKKRQDGCLCY